MDLFVALLLMTLASYRLTRLVVKDTFPPVLWLRDRLAGGWRPLTLGELEEYTRSGAGRKAVLRTDWSYGPDDEEPQRYVRRARWSPVWLAELITCPWCASAYVSAAVVLGTWTVIDIPPVWLVWGAVWAGSALLASQEWS